MRGRFRVARFVFLCNSLQSLAPADAVARWAQNARAPVEYATLVAFPRANSFVIPGAAIGPMRKDPMSSSAVIVTMTKRVSCSERFNMSNVFSRAYAVFAVCGGLLIGACGSPSQPSVIPSSNQTQGAELGESPALAGSAALTVSAAGGVTDLTLAKAGWACLTLPDRIICAPPGLGLPSIPPVPNNGGAPTYHITAFTLDHQFLDRARFLRPDLYHGEPCLGGDPWTYFPLIAYFECLDPA